MNDHVNFDIQCFAGGFISRIRKRIAKRSVIMFLLMLTTTGVFGAAAVTEAAETEAVTEAAETEAVTEAVETETETEAACDPVILRVEPSEANGLPAGIDAFMVHSDDLTVCQLYLPGNVDPAQCFLSWDGSMQAVIDGQTYESGNCPVPSPDTEKTCSFMDGDLTAASYRIETYQGSAGVQPVFIDIDESEGNATIEQMDGDPVHKTSCTGRIWIGGQWYDGMKIKGRGNTTWEQSVDKKPYNIMLDSKINFPGIDSEPTKKWSFLAEILDHSLLCNRTGFYLAYELGVGQDTASADVWMNGEYQGCYTVTPKTDSFVSDDGFMIENDNYQEPSVEEGGDPQFSLEGLNGSKINKKSGNNLITVKKMGDNLLMNDGEVDESPENMTAAAEKLQSWLQDAWDAIRSDTGRNSKGRYYTDYIDIESFARMYLVHEYIKSYDICAGSILFHRDGQTEGDKLIAGPVWDLDNAMGSTSQNNWIGEADDRVHGDRRSGEGYYIMNVDAGRTSIYKTLYCLHEDFRTEVKDQCEQYRYAFGNLPDTAAAMIDEIASSAKMNHIKVQEITTGINCHKYPEDTTLGSGEYLQKFLATTDSKNDWENYAANLLTYIRARSLWFETHSDFGG